jgi:hypothetical protein
MAFEKDNNQNALDLTPPEESYQQVCPLVFDIDTVSDNQLLIWLDSFQNSEYLVDKITIDLDFWVQKLKKVLE